MPGTEDNLMRSPEPPGRGPVGETGATGATGAPGISRSTKLLATALLALAVILGAANIGSGYIQNSRFERQFIAAQAQAAAAQKAAGALIGKKLCSSLLPLEGLATLRPPAGNPVNNPSRAYEQQLSAKLAPLAQLGADIGCRS